ncbi:caspase family protein [Sediminispirochaeta smaragdinae]|uniref:Peptidase C14 caspase catalytic subunit p20 n=1 Tax=Sediminispirochaeta smaragdinae (strain DSM 11293 / JCM 15392 / SEBR 4228) TaxID=573413 RepID=E1R1Q1_SEDSS|nr:caspase family protein [Sediminispirochaeta smaragdinae]ADK81427.1 peptidase C14 caspase catalytic subunit p20 [Sediminispirochaeta smaragdinae DSM 11293]
MNQRRISILCLSVGFTLVSCSVDINFPERYALVYGVADYPDGYNDLTYTVNDADSMADLFEEKGYIVRKRTDSEVTASAIQSDIEALDVPKNALLLFYFSGHGTSDDDESYIVCCNDTGSDAAFISGTTLASWLAKVPCNKKVVILDSCYAAGLIGEGYSEDGYPDDWDGGSSFAFSLSETIENYFSSPSSSGISYDDAIVLAAAGSDEKSFEGGTVGHGYFTYGLLRGAVHGDDDGDGYLSTLELYDYARDYIEGLSFLTTDGTVHYYLPHISGGPVDFILFEMK